MQRRDTRRKAEAGGDKSPCLNQVLFSIPPKKANTGANAISANNASPKPGLAPAGVAMPTPILDQLQISIWKGLHQADIVQPTFEEAFGKPQPTNDGTALRWKALGIAMSTREKWAYRLIRFPATQAALAAISPLLTRFPRRPDGKAAAQLRSAEIAWDFPASTNYHDAAEQLFALAAVTMLNNKRARLRIMEPKCFGLDSQPDCSECHFFHRCQRCRDGASNGKATFSFRSLGKYFVENEYEDEDGYFQCMPSKGATFWGKIYCKQLFVGAPWGIRFEVTLLGQKLEDTIGKALPSDLTLLPRRMAGLCFKDFWYFEKFNWSSFMESARRSADYKCIAFAKVKKMALLLSRHAIHEGHNITAWQKRNAKKIAQTLNSQPLQDKIGAGKFSIPLQIEYSPPKIILSEKTINQ